MDRISTFGKSFVDDKGRERIFSGMNIVDKSIYQPGEQNYMDIDEDIIRKAAEDGFNLIRLGFTWAKLEPKPGEYNDRYIDSLEEIIDYCEKYNIFVYLDMHQDLYSQTTGLWGDGAPEWATVTDGIKAGKTHFVWAEAYFWGKACHRAFDNFWDNREFEGKGLQDYYSDCWRHLVKRLGSKPAVIGYDMLNEPFPGSPGGQAFKRIVKSIVKIALFDKDLKRCQMLKDLFCNDRVERLFSHLTYKLVRKATTACDDIIETFDTKRYAPFLNKVSENIRDEGGDGVLFMENCYYSNLGIPVSTPPITVNGQRDKKQAFAPHAYDFMVDTPLYKYASNDRVGGIFGEHKRTQERLNVPVVVGEWGGFAGGDKDTAWLKHIEYLLDLFDKNKWSNTYWCYIPGFFESPLMEVFSRPYPKAVSGTIENYRYDLEGRLFTLDFIQNKNDCGESVLSVPFNVKTVTVDGKRVKVKKEGTELYLKTSEGHHSVAVELY